MGLPTQGLGDAQSGGGGAGFSVDSVAASANTVTIAFQPGFPATSLTGPSANPADWAIAVNDGTSAPVTVLGVAIDLSGNVVLTTTNQTGGGSYLLTIPLGISSNGAACLGPFVQAFSGVATIPGFLSIIPKDSQIVDVMFTVMPDQTAVMNPARWSISPTLTVTAVQKITDTLYRLTVSRQSIGQLYTVTWPV
jgi:hypothetical protein